jgi:hypothetical protein
VLTKIEQPGWLDAGQRWAVSPIEDRQYEGLDTQELVELAAPLFEQDEHATLLVVDETTITAAEHPVLIIELEDTAVGELAEAEGERTRSFRARACAVAEVDANLSIAHLDWEDFAGAGGNDEAVFEGMI